MLVIEENEAKTEERRGKEALVEIVRKIKKKTLTEGVK